MDSKDPDCGRGTSGAGGDASAAGGGDGVVVNDPERAAAGGGGTPGLIYEDLLHVSRMIGMHDEGLEPSSAIGS